MQYYLIYYSFNILPPQIDESTVLISELQINTWTTTYKQFLESVLIGGATPDGEKVAPFIKDFKENHTDTTGEWKDSFTNTNSHRPTHTTTIHILLLLIPLICNNRNRNRNPTLSPLVSFTITLAPEKLMEINEEPGGLTKKFKLETSIATSNMTMFDLNSQIRKFDNTSAILHSFFKVRYTISWL